MKLSLKLEFRYRMKLVFALENIRTEKMKVSLLEGVLGLNWSDINFQKGFVTVHLKGGGVENLPLGEFSEIFLRELKETGNNGKIGPNDPVFVTEAGKRMSYGRFVFKMKRYMTQAGIPKEKQHMHGLRHTCGTRTTKNYGPYATKLLLCHSRLQTTELYVHLTAEDDLMAILRPDKIQANRNHDLDKPARKKCPKCNSEYGPDRKLCICGYDFTLDRCENCGKSIESNANFCPFCGKNHSVPKPSCICGNELHSEYKVCPKCGANVEEILKLWNEKFLKKWQDSFRSENNNAK